MLTPKHPPTERRSPVDNQDASDCNMKGVIMGSKEDALQWIIARDNMRNIIRAYGYNDMFGKESAAYNYATDILVELLEFLYSYDIISGWDADALTDLLDSMCSK